jgi:hypothetical protein
VQENDISAKPETRGLKRYQWDRKNREMMSSTYSTAWKFDPPDFAVTPFEQIFVG